MRHERANPLLSLGAVHEREAQSLLTIEGSKVSPLADRRGVRLAQEAHVHRADIVALEQRRYAGAKWRAWATTDPLVRRQCGSSSACRWWGMRHQAPRDNQQREHGERRLENSRESRRGALCWRLASRHVRAHGQGRRPNMGLLSYLSSVCLHHARPDRQPKTWNQTWINSLDQLVGSTRRLDQLVGLLSTGVASWPQPSRPSRPYLAHLRGKFCSIFSA